MTSVSMALHLDRNVIVWGNRSPTGQFTMSDSHESFTAQLREQLLVTLFL